MNYIETLNKQLQAMATGMVQMLPTLAIALLVLLLTWMLARSAVRIADMITRRTSLRQDLKLLIDTLVKLGIWLVGTVIALTIAIPSFTLGGAVAGLGVGALAIGFAFQDIFENFLAGVLLMLRDKMNVGDVIEFEGMTGRVEKTTLRETHIRQLSNELTVVPNSMLFKNPVKILTDETIRRNEIVVGVSYDADLVHARDVILKAVETVQEVNTERPIVAYAQEFNASSIDFLVQWWANSAPRDLRETKSEVVIAIKKALDAEGIEIPFPQLTMSYKDDAPSNDAESKAVPA
ncbi:MAG: mechanosensitive ion channel family protein [Novosphingobium sp.]|nr:mechanosensitive ion channel family protein [Novosphingobium sp.]